jgi:membrane protease subunit HflK
MAWNEPGGGKDPWGGGQGSGPPDLDEALKKLRQKFGRVAGGKNGGGNNGSNSGDGGFSGGNLMMAIALVVLVLWGFAGAYQVDEKERAVVLRFGKYLDTLGPGLHWNPPLIDSVMTVPTTEERQYRNKSHDLMLTEDENIVDLQLVVQYNIKDIKDYVLNVKNPDVSLEHATDSALRHVVGSTRLDEVISTGREQVSLEVKERLQTYLDAYGTGIHIIKINIQDAKPPVEVKAAYDDVIKAREDQERVVNEAQSYSNGIVPEARGRAQRVIEEANAYQAKVIAEAEGEAERFENLLVEYNKAPEVTRQRLYIDTLQNVMSSSTKVMVNTDGGNNIFYLPLDKAMKVKPTANGGGGGLSAAEISALADAISKRVGSADNNSNKRGLR